MKQIVFGWWSDMAASISGYDLYQEEARIKDGNPVYPGQMIQVTHTSATVKPPGQYPDEWFAGVLAGAKLLYHETATSRKIVYPANDQPTSSYAFLAEQIDDLKKRVADLEEKSAPMVVLPGELPEPSQIAPFLRLNPEKFYIENVRAAYGSTEAQACEFCEAAVKAGVFDQAIELLHPQYGNAIGTYANEEAIPDHVNISVMIDGDEKEQRLSAWTLTRLPVYKVHTKIHILFLVFILSFFIGSCHADSVDHIGPVTLPHVSESNNSFTQRESALIRAKWKELQQLGHASNDGDYMSPHVILGQYGWHGTGKGYFGAYSFYAPAFEQAKKNWWIHGRIAKGTNLLRSVTENIRFDESIIGYSVGPIYMTESKDFLHGAKVVAVVDAQTVRIDRIAETDGEQYNLELLSPNFLDMCNCTNNFSPFGGEKNRVGGARWN